MCSYVIHQQWPWPPVMSHCSGQGYCEENHCHSKPNRQHAHVGMISMCSYTEKHKLCSWFYARMHGICTTTYMHPMHVESSAKNSIINYVVLCDTSKEVKLFLSPMIHTLKWTAHRHIAMCTRPYQTFLTVQKLAWHS